MEKRKTYERDFKVNAVRLGLERGRLKVSKELGIPSSNIYQWQKELQEFGTGSFCGSGFFRNPEQKRASELKKELEESELLIEIFKSASDYISKGKPAIFHFIENNADRYPLWKMCKVLGINTGTYHKWKNHEISPRQRQTILLEQAITSIFYEYKERYGSIRISAELLSRGFKLSRSQVTFYMKKLGLTSKLGSKRKAKTGLPFIPHNPCVFPNVLNRQFETGEPSQAWVSGITSLQVLEGLLFLTIVMDLYDRKIIGCILSDGLKIIETTMPAWEMAVRNRKTKEGLIFHSDRGPQYANKLFTRKLNSNKDIRRSMSRQGDHLDNAIPRRFFISLKSELEHSKVLLTKRQMEGKILEYAQNWP